MHCIKTLIGLSSLPPGYGLNGESTVVLDNNSKCYLIMFPHTLISGTTVSMGLTCQRQAVLLELFKTDGPNELMIFGTLMHEVFDFVIKEKGMCTENHSYKSRSGC